MRSLLTAGLLSVTALLVGCSDDAPFAPEEPSVQAAHTVQGEAGLSQQLAQVRRATAPYNDLEEAEADGYHLEEHCESNPAGPGAMGMHAVNMDLVGDGELDPLQPEVLVYMPREDDLELVAVEYFALEGPFEEAPSLFGETFVDHTENPHGLPPHFELHAWIWHPNPDGVFTQWNPGLSCPSE